MLAVRLEHDAVAYTNTTDHSGIMIHCTAHSRLVCESSHTSGEHRECRPTVISKHISLYIHTAIPSCLQASGQPTWNHIELLHTQSQRNKTENSEHRNTRQFVLRRVCPLPTLNAASRLYRHNRATAKRNASFTLTAVPAYLQDFHTRNKDSFMLRCYGKAKYASSLNTHHTTFVFIRCTLNLQPGKTVRHLARKSLSCFMPHNVQKIEPKQLQIIRNLQVFRQVVLGRACL